MSINLKAAGQAEIAKRLREFADEVERGHVVVVEMDPSMMQERGSAPEWLLTLRWKRPADSAPPAQEQT